MLGDESMTVVVDMVANAAAGVSRRDQASPKVRRMFCPRRINSTTEDVDEIKVDQASIKSRLSGDLQLQNRRMHIRHSTSRRALGALLGGVAGALVGATIGWAPVHALTVAPEGAGYGGTAGALQVTVQGEQVVVTGSGFMAHSAVDVSAGDLTASVIADDVGGVHAVLSGASAVSSAAAVSATGTAVDGSSTVRVPVDTGTSTGGSATAVGAMLGAAPFIVMRRRRREVA